MAIRKRQDEDEVAITLALLIKGGGYVNPEDAFERRINKILGRMKDCIAGVNGGDALDAELISEQELRSAVIVMLNAHRNPKSIPKEQMKHVMKYPSFDMQPPKAEIIDSINGPTRGIRAKCMSCMGNDAAGIRNCPSINCALWPFRMGHNPFYGRISDAEVEAVETDAEVEAMEEQHNNEIGAA